MSTLCCSNNICIFTDCTCHPWDPALPANSL